MYSIFKDNEQRKKMRQVHVDSVVNSAKYSRRSTANVTQTF